MTTYIVTLNDSFQPDNRTEEYVEADVFEIYDALVFKVKVPYTYTDPETGKEYPNERFEPIAAYSKDEWAFVRRSNVEAQTERVPGDGPVWASPADDITTTENI